MPSGSRSNAAVNPEGSSNRESESLSADLRTPVATPVAFGARSLSFEPENSIVPTETRQALGPPRVTRKPWALSLPGPCVNPSGSRSSPSLVWLPGDDSSLAINSRPLYELSYRTIAAAGDFRRAGARVRSPIRFTWHNSRCAVLCQRAERTSGVERGTERVRSQALSRRFGARALMYTQWPCRFRPALPDRTPRPSLHTADGQGHSRTRPSESSP